MPTVITFVSMEFLRASSRSATLLANGRDGIHHRFQHRCFVHISARMPYDERDSSSFDHKMALRARFAAIRWVRAGRFAPPGRAPCLHPGWPATNPVARLLPVFLIASGAAVPRHLQLANLAIAASRSSHCHSPSPTAAFPRECLSATRIGSRLILLGWRGAVCRLSVF